MNAREPATPWLSIVRDDELTTAEVERFAARFEHLPPKAVLLDDPDLRAALERLAEHVDGIMWELTDGAPGFRP